MRKQTKPKPNYIPAPGKAKGYRYKDKDPILYLVLHLMDESGLSDNKISQISGVTTGTLHRWRYEDVRRPQFPTIRAVLRAIEVEFAGITSSGHIIKFTEVINNLISSNTYPLKASQPKTAGRK